ncbi:MAG: TonB-dependent receptor domain-containing protein [Bacteroidia bacterium]
MRATLFLWVTLVLWAQKVTTLTLVLQDSLTGEPLMGARVYLPSLEVGGFSDSLGEVVFRDIPREKYPLEVRISYVGYLAKVLTVNRPLQERLTLKLTAETSLEGVEITEEKSAQARAFVVQQMRSQVGMLSGLAGDEIRALPDPDAAQLLRRLPSVRVEEGKFVNVRGMSPRYNLTLIGNLPAASSEVENRSFALDLVPSSTIAYLQVHKMPHAALPADFGGGIVQVFPRYEAGNFTKIGISGGYRIGTTIRQGAFLPAGAHKDLPKDFPSMSLSSLSLREGWDAAKLVQDDFAYRRAPILPNGAFTLTHALKRGRYSTFHHVALQRSNQFYVVDRYRYLQPQGGELPLFFTFRDSVYEQETPLSWVGTFRFLPSSNFQMGLRGFLANLATEEVTLREGISNYQRPNAVFRNYSLRYLLRRVVSVQAEGRYTRGQYTWDWVLGYNYLIRREPNLRRWRTVREFGDSLYRVVLPPGATTFDASRFYAKLKENQISFSCLYTYKKSPWQLQAGTFAERVQRSFQARWFSYVARVGTPIQWLDSLLALPAEKVFTRENVGPQKLSLYEGTNPTDRYEADSWIGAFFGSATYEKGPWRLQAGTRVEYSQQNLQTQSTSGPLVSLERVFFLPSVEVLYKLNSSWQVRGAYGQSLNRPQLRELAPFTYYDFGLTVDKIGNPGLKIAQLHHADLRLEWYALDEVFCVGGFYKNIQKPIEQYILRGADNPIFSFGNAQKANLYGFEAEFRKRIWAGLMLIGNVAYIFSQVDLGEEARIQEKQRPLQGQAPYLINVGVQRVWNKFSLLASYNYAGPRLYGVGDDFLPSWYEMPRHVVDFSCTYKLRRWEITFLGQNLLNAEYLYLQDTYLRGSIKRGDVPVIRYKLGQLLATRIMMSL